MIDRIMMDSEDFHEIAPKGNKIGELLKEKFDLFVVGQEEAKSSLISALTNNLNSIVSRKGPLGCFYFAGPTGVGKTEMAHALASMLLGHQNRLTKIKGEHYQQPHSITNLIGSPKSYVGYNDQPVLGKHIYRHYEEAKESGQLSPLLRLFPNFNIILIDEVEKICPSIHQALLGIMDDGVATLSNGETIDFSSSIIIMTSNLGAREISEAETKRTIGFVEADKSTDVEAIRKESLKLFSPEFRNRIDKVIHFHHLTKEDCKKIVDIQVERINAQFEGWAENAQCTLFNLELDDSAYTELIERGYDKEKGARELKRVFDREINSKLGETISHNPELTDFIDYKVKITCSYNDRFIFGIKKPDIELLVKTVKEVVTDLTVIPKGTIHAVVPKK